MKVALAVAAASLMVPFASASGPGTQKSTVTVTANPLNATAGSTVTISGAVQPASAAMPQPTPAPTGALTFYDGATPLNSTPTTLVIQNKISSATFQQTFGTVDSSISAGTPGELAGDFTGSGQTDLILYGNTSTSGTLIIQVFVPKAGAGYTGLATQTLNFTPITASMNLLKPPLIPVGIDVNGDGKLDLLDGISVAYGNGDGTFQPPVTLPFLSTGYLATWVADVNGDGKADILAIKDPGPLPGTSSQTFNLEMTVFQNEGSGTFNSLGTFAVANSGNPASFTIAAAVDDLEFADLNGDGKTDIVAQVSFVPMGNAPGPPSVAVVLNNGDGTFAAPQTYLSQHTAENSPPAIGDFNGDGKPDLALAYNDGTGRANLSIALGNGDGTFATGQSIDLNPTPGVVLTQIGNLVVGDFNADGKLDVALGDGLWAMGNGDGTFQVPSSPLFTPVVSNLQIVAFPVVPFLFAGNPVPGLVYLNSTANDTAVITQVIQATASMQASSLSVGEHSITAAYSGDTNYAAATSAPVVVDITPVPTLTLSGNTSLTVNSGSSVSTPISVIGGGGLTGTVTFACSGLPANVTCSFNPQAVSVAANGTASTTMTVTTPSGSGHAELVLPFGIGGSGTLALAFMMLVPNRRRRSRALWLGAACLAILAGAGMMGCSGGSSSTRTPAGTYSFTVTASSGSLQSNLAYTLTVQ